MNKGKIRCSYHSAALEEVVQWWLGAKLQTDRRKQSSKWRGADSCEITESYLSSIFILNADSTLFCENHRGAICIFHS